MTPDQAFDILMPFEGGDKYTENPNDLGKGTKYGISAAAYPDLDIKNLDEVHARAIYGTDYWLKVSCQKIKSSALQYVHFDTCVNCGVEEAINLLQMCCGINPQTGFFGSETLTKSDDVTVGEYLFLREVYDVKIVEHRQQQIVNLGGWTNRNVAILDLYKQGKLN